MFKEFIPYEQAKELKEVGFDEECITHYYDGEFEGVLSAESWPNKNSTLKSKYGEQVSTPTYSQAFRWFRGKYKLAIWPEPTGSGEYNCRYDGLDDEGKRWVGYLRDDTNFVRCQTYEEAELACLKKLIEIIKEK